jgi:hypothetical protein
MLLCVILYFSVLLHKLCFSYSAFDRVEVINMGLESVRAAASWPVTVLICAPAYDPDGHALFFTFSGNLSLLCLLLYQK